MPLSRASRSAKNRKRNNSSGKFITNKHKKNGDLEFNESDDDYSEESDYDSDGFMDQRMKYLTEFELVWTNTAELE